MKHPQTCFHKEVLLRQRLAYLRYIDGDDMREEPLLRGGVGGVNWKTSGGWRT